MSGYGCVADVLSLRERPLCGKPDLGRKRLEWGVSGSSLIPKPDIQGQFRIVNRVADLAAFRQPHWWDFQVLVGESFQKTLIDCSHTVIHCSGEDGFDGLHCLFSGFTGPGGLFDRH